MKTAFSPVKTLLFGAGALAASLGIASAQSAFTTPVGYHTETVQPGFNVIGINLVDAPLVSSAATGVAGNVITDSAVDFTTALTDGTSYTVEFADGSWSAITAFDANTITTASATTAAADSAYIVRKMRTLGDYFGADNSAGFLEGGATDGDVIWIPAGEGFEKAYYSPGGGFDTEGWKRVGAAGDQDGFAIPYTAGLIIQRRGEGNLDLTFTGHVKLTSTTVTADAPFTYLSRVYPTGSTLGNSGLEASIKKGSATEGTNIWLATGPSAFNKAYFSPGGGFEAAGWALVGEAGDQADTELTSGIIVERRQDAFDITLTPPAFYGDL